MIFTLPPTRGMVSFDAVTRRLPAAQQGMTFARGNDATVCPCRRGLRLSSPVSQRRPSWAR